MMNHKTYQTSYTLSIMVAFLAAVASACGLLIEGFYRDNALVTAAWRGNDLVTLVVAVPLLTASLVFIRRGSQRALLIWMAMLGYMLYNYAFYLFGAAFNHLFLVYVALFSLSTFALALSLPRLDAAAVRESFATRTPVRWVSGFMLFIAVVLGGIELAMASSFLFTGQVPQSVLQTGHPTGVVFALDLSLLIPTMVVSAILLWKRQPWGFVLGMMMMVKGATYTLALLVMVAFALKVSYDPLAPLWGVLFAGCLACCVALFRNMKISSA